MSPIDCVFSLYARLACAHDSLTQMEGTAFTKGKNHMEEQMEEYFSRARQEDSHQEDRKMIGHLPHNHQSGYCR